MSDSLSIAIVCYPSLGGSGVVASDLAAGLAELGHRVHVIASAPPSRTLPHRDGLSFHPVQVSEYPLFDHPPYELAVASSIVELARAQRLDVVHVHYAVPHAASALLARQILGPSAPRIATTLHGTDVTRLGADPRYREVIRFTVAASDGLTAPSEFLRHEAEQLLGASDAARIQVIPNFVDTNRFAPAASRDRARLAALFAHADDKARNHPVLFHVSNFRSVKRAADLIDVLARVRRQVPARLVLVGDGPDREPTAQRARDLGVADSVCFLGDRPDFVDQLRDADAFVLPSESESFGVAALEAMSCGVPVYGYRVGGLPELVGDHAGELVEPFDVDALARAVLGGINDPTRRHALGRAARERAVRHFDRTPAIARYATFYRRLLSAASILVFLAVSLLSPQRTALAEEPAMHAGMLAHALDRLANTGRVLYVGAHPDDENTRLLAYLANERHVTAAYLSMTRGGGGQNLIGTEQAELLDVIRTQELLAARRLDGAVQRFTRMRDFGYSKTAEETLAIWGREEALADVVWVIRAFRPDVLITRFDLQLPNHGHHTASAILAEEAFRAAADPNRFPEQLARGAVPWQAERLLNNWSQWRGGEPPTNSIALDVGAYDPRLGLGYGELAALSRSQHKSQGFGVAGERGSLVERFIPLAGTRPAKDILEGVKLDWSRFGNAAAPLRKALDEARRTLERDRPERALPALLQAHRALDALPGDDPRVRDARAALVEIVAAASGLFLRAVADSPAGVPGDAVSVSLEAVLRRPTAMILERATIAGAAPTQIGAALQRDEKRQVPLIGRIPDDAPVSAPYWLAAPSLPGRQAVSDPQLVGAAEGPPPVAVGVEITAGDRLLRFEVPVLWAWTDQVAGERTRTFLIEPPATVTPSRQAVMFPNGRSATVGLRIRAGRDKLLGDVVLPLPAGWRAEPESVPVTLDHAGEETSVQIRVTPPQGAAPIDIRPAVKVDGREWSYRADFIDYAHIPFQVVLQQASLRLAPLELRLPKGTVGYIPGPGDTVAEDLAHVGVDMKMLDDETIRSGDLERYAAIVVGIRAYNTREALRSAHERLMQYVERGGTVVVQYNTNNRLAPLAAPVGPFPLTIGRDRITDETAAMTAIDPKAPILNEPNLIGPADFDGWVQERGLYYAESWDDRYTPIFRSNDPGEQPLLGGLLVARHGKGRYVYTGLAFFRQLPAGVPGAYRLFANLIGAD